MIKFLKDLTEGETFTMHADKRSTPMVVESVSTGQSLTRVNVLVAGTSIHTTFSKPSLSTVDVI